MVKFGIESKHSCPSTSTAAFKECITTAMQDMRFVCVAGLMAADTSGQSYMAPDNVGERGLMSRL